MYAYYLPVAGGFLLLACVIVFLWILLARSKSDRIPSIRDTPLPGDDLEEHARKAAIQHTVSSKRRYPNWPVPRMNDNYASILSVYRELNEELRKKHAVPGMAEWLLDNFYLIEEQSKLIRRDLSRKGYSRLPVLKSGALKGYTRIYAVATEFFLHTDCRVDEATLGNYLEAYQSHTILFEREIQAIPIVMSLAVLENIRRLCENIRETLAQRKKADELVDRWMAGVDTDAATALERFMVDFGFADLGEPSFLEHVFYRLRRSGRSYATVLRRVDERLAQFETDTVMIAQREHAAQSMDTISMGNCITSLRFLSSLDWSGLFETASFVERILNRDPDGTYPLMDLATRGLYRGKVEEYARTYGVSEPYIAKRAVALANEAYLTRDPDAPEGGASARTWHVGYYLIGNGKKILADDRKDGRAASMVKNHPGWVYLGAIGLIVLLLSAIAAQHAALSAPSYAPLFGMLSVLAVLLPASEIAVCAVNWVVCKALKPAAFPRLALEDGISEEMSAMIVVPTLLPDAKRAAEILRNLEGHYLRNREKNLYFALIGAFQDADSASSKEDKAIIQTGMAVVAELNAKYSKNGCDKFFYFHRENRFNEKSNRWFGWERKRGALMEFNDMVLGSKKTSFAYSSCATPPFSRIRYVITLDSDTILPMGMAKKLIGTMAHPLNRPIMDERRGIVVDGYGLMQPRVDIDSESSGKTLFARIFAGHEGLDPYANAISNVYQDLFGEGVFTGKGIYDLKVFQSVLKNAIPDNTVLSHDLLEGSYVRTGLLSDLRMIDSFPAGYNSFVARMRRWVRGDWQLFPYLFKKIATRSGAKITNPLPLLARWKMLDNLRRSLISPSLMVLVALGMSVLPGNAFFWLFYFFAALGLPFVIAVVEYTLSQRIASDRIKRHIPVVTGLKAAFLQLLLTLIFLPYQALLMVRAVLVTLVRVFITKKNMLEWIPSADVEKSQVNTPRSYFLEMGSSLVPAALTFLLAQTFKPEAALICLPLLLLWVSAPLAAWYTSRECGEVPLQASGNDVLELRRISRKTWRYFEDLANAKNHFLPPDNYQVDPPRGIAHRTSPTNIGLGLLAILSARDFGYIGTGRMLELLEHSVSTIESLEKWNGHLYNWYDTYTLKPLRPGYVSTVDSGNYVGNLITLRQGLRDYLSCPLLDSVFADGLIDTLRCSGDEGIKSREASPSFQALSAAWLADPVIWSRNLESFIQEYGTEDSRDSIWKNKARGMAVMFRDELAEYLPYVDLLRNPPQNPKVACALHEIAVGREEIGDLLGKSIALKNLPAAYTRILGRINTQVKLAWRGEADVYKREFLWFGRLKESLITSRVAAENLIGRFNRLAGRIDALSVATRFLPLFSKKKQLFSIGFGVEDGQLTNSYYDLLASEARLTSYLSIARGEIPFEHWFRMGRALTAVDGYQGLVSWTGTMFEYLMPLLMMKSFKNSLLDETYSFVIRSQIKYGRQKDMPWGVSESGYNLLDQNHDYQYKAIGVPWLGLKRGLIEDAVVAPYAAFLALMVDPGKAIPNIARLKREGMEGSHGFYEAADYTPERLPFEAKKAVVKSFMAHHQGMSLASLNNCLHKNVLKTRFHTDPEINAARFLLEEKIPSNLLFTKETQEKVVPFKEAAALEKQPIRSFTQLDPMLPRAHILTNGNYSVMITDRGTGYSKTRMATVTRWRADSTLDAYGMFLYVRNLEANSVWSAAYGPLNALPEQYEVVFTPDKALFKRTDGCIETKTEVMVATGDNVEIRRISLRNTGGAACTLEVTSYFEVVLATQAADVAHPAFGNLSVETGYQAEPPCVFAHRRSNSEQDPGLWLANAAIVEGEPMGDIQYETDRLQWLGRGRSAKLPIVIERNSPLSGTVGPVLDPAMSLRAQVRVEPGKTARVSFVVAVSENKEMLLALVDRYKNADAVKDAFRLALTRSEIETGYLNLEASEMELYQNMLRDILFISPMRKTYRGLILENRGGQSSLWRYGISGDTPIVLVVLHKAERLEILHEVLKAHEYWRLMEIKVDLVLLSEEECNYALPLNALISDIVLSRQTHNLTELPKDVFILDRNKVQSEDVPLLYAVARVILVGDGRTLSEQAKAQPAPALPPVRAVVSAPKAYAHSTERERALLYYNGLGGFSSDGSEYVIRLERDKNTPAPWINVISNPNFGFTVSESGSGYAWAENSHENKLTPWSNDGVSDTPGEALYLTDADTGESWTATCLPIREEEPYAIRHGFGYSVFEHASHGIEQCLTLFVPVDEDVKLSLLQLKNVTKQKRRLLLTYYIQPVLGVSEQNTAMHIQTRLGNLGELLVENHYNTDFAGRILFVDASIEARTVTGDRREFFGVGGMDAPDCLRRKRLSGEMGVGFDPCAALQVEIELGPGESREISFLMGLSAGEQQAEILARKYRSIENARAALAACQKFWTEKLGAVRVETPSGSMNLLLNGWLQYQVISCRLWARTGFYQSGGAVGFRDQLQDCLAIATAWPEAARAQILVHAGHQFLEGDVMHWWHDPMGKGTRTRSSDDFLWLPYVVAEYCEMTGDYGILDEKVGFVEDRPLDEGEDERYGAPILSGINSSLLDHCVRAVEHALAFGAHGLPLMGSGDWNDGMNMVGNKGLGESVWLGWFLASVLHKIAVLCRGAGDEACADRYDKIREKLATAIEESAWDGGWYRRAYFDSGVPLGSAQNGECKIDSIAQSWALISKVGDPGRAAQAMKALENYLIVREDGIIKLLTPPFDAGDAEPGYIKGYLPGVRENGGQYTHAAVWVIIAFAQMGDGGKAEELFHLINPINHTRSFREYFRYKDEPYVMAADVYTASSHVGRGGWSWYTGSAGWMYRAGLENILGIHKKGDTLVIDPRVPPQWRAYTVAYRYGATRYAIRVTNPDGAGRGVKCVSVDGATTQGNLIRLVDDGVVHDVVVYME